MTRVQREDRELPELGNHCPLDKTLTGVGSGLMATMREDQWKRNVGTPLNLENSKIICM